MIMSNKNPCEHTLIQKPVSQETTQKISATELATKDDQRACPVLAGPTCRWSDDWQKVPGQAGASGQQPVGQKLASN